MLKEHYLIWLMCIATMCPAYNVKGAEKGSSVNAVGDAVSKMVKRSKYVEEVAEPIIIKKLKKMLVTMPIEEKNTNPIGGKSFFKMRDPTRPVMSISIERDTVEEESDSTEESQKDERIDPWALTSTIVSPGRRTATINGKTVSKGDIINGAVILGIFPLSVKLKKDNKVTVLDMSSSPIKKPAK